MVKDAQSGQVILLENLRFHPGEEKPEKSLTSLSSLLLLAIFISMMRLGVHIAHTHP